VYTDRFLAWALKSNKLKIYHPKRKAPHTVPKKVKEEKPMMSLCAKANAFFTLCYLQLGGDHKFTEPFRFAQMCQPNNVFSLNNSLIFSGLSNFKGVSHANADWRSSWKSLARCELGLHWKKLSFPSRKILF